MSKDKMSKNTKKGFFSAGTITWLSVTAVVMAVLIVLTVLENGLLRSIFGTVLGGRTPVFGDNSVEIYTSEYDSKEQSVEAGNELNVRIEEEGAVLLVNEDNALPLARGSRVSVFGKNSVDIVLGGSGSGRGSGVGSTIFDGLEAGGFEYNPILRDFYESDASGAGSSDDPELSQGSSSAPTLEIGETPVSMYNADVIGSFRDYNDAAIVVISRLGGESWDLPRYQSDDASRHYLQLDATEYDMLDMVTTRFDKVIVLLNTLTSFQCDFIAEYNNTVTNKRIDAVMWIGGPGATGAEAIGSLLNGDVNPSGRTVDTWARDFRLDPTWQNFGDGLQTTSDGSGNTSFMNSGAADAELNMVMYEEGIYVGYRYYETRAYEETLSGNNPYWYEENVIFPFGYGLSYTEFNQSFSSEPQGSLNALDGSVTLEVTVENIGDAAGKDVVQLYVEKPYNRGGIEKSQVELVDFTKTDILSTDGEGSTATITFTVDAYDLASYDYNDANGNGFYGYELEAGDYIFYVSSNSHVVENAYDSVTVTVTDGLTFVNDPVTGNPVVNRYTDAEGESTFNDSAYRISQFTVNGQSRYGMSRMDFERTFPTAPTAEERAFYEARNGVEESAAIRDTSHNNTDIADEVEGQTLSQGDGGEYMILDLVDTDSQSDTFGQSIYTDERWEALIDRISFEDMLELVNNGAFMTAAIESVGKNLTNDSDGPVGFVNFQPGAVSEIFADNTTFAAEIVIGSTWNKDLAYQMGKIVGENGLWGDQSGNNGLPYSGWYAPAVNLHRSPFAGRNFEYYSEDPILSGKMAVNVITGARTKGVYTDLKHFALNDQETNRAGVCTYVTEQAMRELYLKPFEIAVKADDDMSHVPTAMSDRQNGILRNSGAQSGFFPTIGIMSSFNRIGTRWTGGDYRLCTQILRDEWGFEGLVICDYKTEAYMNSRQMLYAGNDLILTSTGDMMWNDANPGNAEDVAVLRNAVHNILYTYSNSNSVGLDIVGYNTEWWITATIVVDCVAAVAFAIWGFFVVRRHLKNKKKAV